jgi:hypothetical protein
VSTEANAYRNALAVLERIMYDPREPGSVRADAAKTWLEAKRGSREALFYADEVLREQRRLEAADDQRLAELRRMATVES